MISAVEPITCIKSREIMRGMRHTNNGKMPKFEDVYLDTSRHSLDSITHRIGKCDKEEFNNNPDKYMLDVKDHLSYIFEQDINGLSDEELAVFANKTSLQIKESYSIRIINDRRDFMFIVCSLTVLWSAVVAVVIAGHFYQENEIIGTFNTNIPIELFTLFGAELVWECIISWIVICFNTKINYTSKLGE